MRAIPCLLALFFLAARAGAEDAKIVLIAGTPSHGPGDHEFNAGILLLEKCLKGVPGVKPVVVKGGWPEEGTEEQVFEGARTIVFYMDGGNNHPMIRKNRKDGAERLKVMKRFMDRGVGLACIHYAVEFPKGEVGDQLLEWLGGYYETGYSKNPHNDLEVTPAAGHPIARGTKPFKANDEWYYSIRFRPADKRVTPVLTGMVPNVPERQTFAWATERENGGRSFGFTGAHRHVNWGIPEFRRLVLNAILWTAKVEAPKDGVSCELTAEDLEKNLDPKGERKQRKQGKKEKK